jgi:hypothetical protein
MAEVGVAGNGDQMPRMQQLRQKPQIRTVSLSEIEVFQIEFMRKKVIYLGTGFRDVERLPLPLRPIASCGAG